MIRYRSLSSRTGRVFAGQTDRFDFKADMVTKIFYVPELALVEVTRDGEVIHIPWHDVQNPVPYDSVVPSMSKPTAALPGIDSKMKGGKR